MTEYVVDLTDREKSDLKGKSAEEQVAHLITILVRERERGDRLQKRICDLVQLFDRFAPTSVSWWTELNQHLGTGSQNRTKA